MGKLGVLWLTGLLSVPETAGGDWQARADRQVLAAHHLSCDGPHLMQFLRGFVLSKADLERGRRLVRQLGDPQFRLREKAQQELLHLGPGVCVLLREAIDDGDLELQRRAARCLKDWQRKVPPAVVEAALRMLKTRASAQATQAILDFLPFAADDTMLDEAIDALVSLGLAERAADHIMEEALSSAHWEQQAAAALVLARRGNDWQQALARQRLSHATPRVRAYVLRGSAGPVQRSRRAASEFLDLLLRGNFPDFQKVCDVPFFLAGYLTVQDRQEFNQVFTEVFQQRKSEQQKGQATVLFVQRADDFVETAPPAERGFLGHWPLQSLRIVHVSVRFADQRGERGALFVYLGPGQARVVGIIQHDGEIRSAAK